MAVSLTNFLDSGCIVASSLALTAWAAAFNFGSAWTAILGAIGANAFGAAVGALIGGFLTDKFGRTTIYKYNLLVYAAGVFIAMVAVNLPMVVVGVVLSGLSVYYHGRTAGTVARTEVKFRELSEAEILAYVESGEPMGKAGSYAIQQKGASFAERIEGDFYNVVGLPVAALLALLRSEFGITSLDIMNF